MVIKKKILSITAFFSYLFYALIVSAAPQISSFSGNMVDESTNVILQGTGFGSNDLSHEWLGDHIDNSVDGNTFSKTNWFIVGSANSKPKYTNVEKHTGQSIVIEFQDTWAGCAGYNPPGTLTNVYVSFWLYLDLGVGPYTYAQYKGWRISEDTSGNVGSYGWRHCNRWDSTTDAWKNMQVSCEVADVEEIGDAGSAYVAGANWIPQGTWVRIETYMQRNTGDDAADGTYWERMLGNSKNVLTWSASNVVTHKTGANEEWESIMFGTYAQTTGTSSKPLLVYYDDIYIAHTQARIEIGDNSNWADCAHREIQIPTVWSDTSITITANQGSFSEGENVYLFVVDADGIPSAGYGPITIGSGEKGDDTTPPGDVTDLTKQVGDGQVVLNWINPADSDFKGTMIRYRTDGTYPANNSDGIEVCNKTALPGTSDTHTLTGLTNGTTYYFSVFTYDEVGNYSETAHISATPSEADSDTTSPGYVTNFGAQSGDSQVVLNWTNPTDSDFAGTMIRYRTDGTYPANNSDGIEVCNKTAFSDTSDTHTLTGLTNGTTYYFSAFTYDEDDNYSKAVHISAIPSANVYTKIFGDISGADFPQTCKDTYLNAGEAEVTYSSNSESLNTYTWPTNTATNRIVMKWDLSALPQDVIIQEATLSLYMHSYGGDDNYEITAHKIINHNPDISSCTWNTYDATNSWTGGANGGEQDIASAESSTIVDKTSGYKNWDITQMVREWVNNPSENYGLMLNSDTTAASDSNRYFRPTEYSSQEQRPVLIIKYSGSDISKVPSAPTGLGVSVISE